MTQELIVKDNGVIARAELDIQITTAKAYPRNIQTAVSYAIDLATMDEATAQSCFYCLPRKEKDGTKKEIRGASIRLAEIMANAWGHIHAGTRIVENDGRHITAEGIAWDLQSNVRISMQNKVSIRFGEKDGKGGYTANNDMQTVLSNAASAKALRNAIFKVIPKALVDRVLEKAMSFSVGDQKTINAKVIDIVDKLVKMGIDKESMLEYYDCKTVGNITPEIYKSLIGVGTAIKEGHIKVDDVFKSEKIPAVSASETINNLILNKTSTVVHSGGTPIADTQDDFTKIKKKLETAKDLDTLDLAADLISSVDMPEKHDELLALYHKRKSEFN